MPNIKSFDFSTPYTTIPHQKILKQTRKVLSSRNLSFKKWKSVITLLVLRHEGPYFSRTILIWKANTLNMLDFLVHDIFVVFGGKVFQQIVGIPIGIDYAPLLADIFLYSHEADSSSLCSRF